MIEKLPFPLRWKINGSIGVLLIFGFYAVALGMLGMGLYCLITGNAIVIKPYTGGRFIGNARELDALVYWATTLPYFLTGALLSLWLFWPSKKP